MEKEKYSESNDPQQVTEPKNNGVDTQNIPYEKYIELEQGFNEERKKMEDRVWLDSNLSRFDELLRANYDSPIKKFTENIIAYISKITGAVYGAFFVVDYEDRKVKATAGYACTVETMDRIEFNIGEGLIGQAAKSKEMLAIDNIETQLNSSLGRINACFLVVSPLVFNDTVYGIIELTTLSKLKPRYLILIDRMSRNIAVALQSLINNQKTKQLLIESLQQAEEYKVKQEEVILKEKELQKLRSELQLKEEALQNALNGMNIQELLSITETQNRIQTLENELKVAQEQVQHKEEELKLAFIKIKNLTNHIADLQEKLAQMQEGNSLELDADSHAQIETLQKKLDTALQDLKTKDQLIQTLLSKRNPNVSSDTSSETIKEQLNELENDLQKKSKEVDMLRETIRWKDAEIDRQDEALLERKRELKQAQDLIAEKEAENFKHLEEIVRQEKTLQQKEAELKSLIQQLDEMKNQLTNNQEAEHLKLETDTLKSALQQKEAELIEILNQLNVERQAVATQQEELQQLRTDFEAQNVAFANLREEFASNQTAYEELREQLSQDKNKQIEHQQELEELKSKLLKKEDELLVSQYLLNQMQNNPLASQEAERLRTNLKQKEEEIQEYKNIIANLQKTTISSEEIETMRKQIELAEQVNDDLNQKLVSLNKELEEKETLLFALKDQIQHNNAHISQTDADELKNLIAELRQKEAENLQQAEALNDLRNQLFDKAKKLDELQNALEQGNQISTIDEEKFLQRLNDLETIQQNLKSKEDDIERHYQVIEKQKEDLVEKYQELETLKEQLQANLLQETSPILEDNAAQYKQEIEVLKAEMKQKEQELSDLFNKINTIFASMEIDMEGNIMTINSKFLMLLGLKLEEVENNRYENLLLPDFVASSEYKVLWEELKLGASQTIEGLICLGNKGKEIPMSVTYVPILGIDGKPYEVVKLVNFVIEPKVEIEAAPKEENTEPIQPIDSAETASVSSTSFEEQQKLQAVDNCFIIAELDLNGNILHVNHQFTVFLGFDEAEVLGKHHRTLIDITDRSSESYLSILNSFETGGFASEILKYVDKEGARVRLRSYFNPVKDVSNIPVKVLVLSQFVN